MVLFFLVKQVKEDKSVVRSTWAAKPLVLDEAADHCFYLRSVLTEIFQIHDSGDIY